MFGRKPFVSTAIGGRHPHLLRKFIQQLESGELTGLRVSVSSKRQLEDIFSEFQPRETRIFWFDIKTKDSPLPIMNVGRAQDSFSKNPELFKKEVEKRMSSTSADRGDARAQRPRTAG